MFMRSVVIYFSLTGNTEKVALAIQKGVKQVAGNCDLIPIKDANPRRLGDYDLIGIGSPVIGVPVAGAEPANIKEFIQNMRFVGGKHAFVFCTHGTHYELFFPRLARMLKRRGMTVIGNYDSYGTVYISAMPKPYPSDGHPDDIDLREAEKFGKQMADNSRRIFTGETGLVPPMPKLPKMGPEPPRNPGEPFIGDHSFEELLKFHPEKCRYPKCKLCMENCPMDGIDLTVKPPVVGKPCIGCEFCCKICPTGAMDGSAYNEFAGPVSAKDIKGFLLTDLVRAEAEGRFRRIVPADKVGTEVPLYLSHTKHPIWVIGKGLRRE
jgi:flavodoxin/NAD-dependent dihydropyrimidine dehydrogenase PreA subunit